MVHDAPLILACLLGSAAAGLAPSEWRPGRRSSGVSSDGTLHCGIFGSGDKSTIENLNYDMRAGGKLTDKTYIIGPGQCNRVHCYDTSAIYVCNDGRVDLKLTGAMIGKGVKCIFDHCCKQEYTGTKYNNGQSGQKFYSGFGSDFNIAVGYGNCGDPVEIRPNNALGWGVNPQCVGGIQVPNPDCSLS